MPAGRYTAVLDACALYPVALRDLLLTISVHGAYAARWTDQIQNEWVRNLLAKRPDLSATALARTVSLMNAAVDDCRITRFEHLIPSLTLPDPDDRHVLAAAIASNADAIVTFNLKDFPEAVAGKHQVKILHPDDFLIDLYGRDPATFLAANKVCRMRMKNPPKTASEQMEALERQGLTQTVALLRTHIDEI
jgi:predicted nucleic acid-binding protein